MTPRKGWRRVATVRMYPSRNVQPPLPWPFVLTASIIAGTSISVLFAIPLVAARSTPRGRPWVYHSCRPTNKVQLTATKSLDAQSPTSGVREELDAEPTRGAEGFDVNMLTAFAKERIGRDIITDEEKLQSDQVAEEEQLQNGQAAKEDPWLSSKDFVGSQDDPYASGDVLEARLLSATNGLDILNLMLGAPDQIVAPRHIAAACRRFALRIKTVDTYMNQEDDFQDFVREAKACLTKSPPDAIAATSLLWSISPGPMQKRLSSLKSLLVPIAAAMPDAAQSMVLRNLTNSITALAKLQHVPPVQQMVPLIVERLTEKVQTEKLSPVQVSATMWALGELGKTASDIPELMDAVLGQLTPESLNAFTNKDLTNFVWGLSLLDAREFELSNRVASLVAERAGSMQQQNAEMDLPMLACALTQMQAMNEETWEAVGSRLTHQKGTFRSIKKWGIAALSWSLPSIAGLDGKTKEMAERVAQQVQKRKIHPQRVERCVLGPARWMLQ